MCVREFEAERASLPDLVSVNEYFFKISQNVKFFFHTMFCRCKNYKEKISKPIH